MRKIILMLMASFFMLATIKAAIQPVQLTCEYLSNPTVVDVIQPRLTWVNVAEKGKRGQTQTAYQLRVSSTQENLTKADYWDSKKVQSNQTTRIKYNGKKLKSRYECWWQVRVWDKEGNVSAWSEPAFWRMGLLSEKDWKATWIGVPWQGEETLPINDYEPDQLIDRMIELPPPAPLLRKEFNLEKKVEKAVAFVTGLGYFELYINGAKVGADVLVPNQTNYGKRPDLVKRSIPVDDNFKEYKVMYLAYDVKELLHKGQNAIGGILGNGFYNPAKYWDLGYGTPRFLLQLHVNYTDGTEEVIVSDASWKVDKSPILMDMVFYGEHYDASKEQNGWNNHGFDDSKWQNAVIRKAPEGKLVAHTAQPDKVMEQLKPISIEKMYNGKYLVDFGVEISGWVKLKGIEGPAGHKIKINYLGNIFSGENSYIFSGKGKEDYAARFNWFVFRQIEIENWPGVLQPEQITAEVVHTFVEETADFETSNPLFNQVNKIWRRSQIGNMHGGIASDCPQRERSAYTGDGQVACVTVMHNYDARNFYQKWIQDMVGSQNVETGYVPNAAPWQPGCGGGVAWGAAISIMPWEFYLHYGSMDMLEDTYPAMKEYIRYMQTWVDKEGIMFSQRVGLDGKVLKWFNLGEWVAPGELPADDLVHTFYFWRCADFTAKAANVLGKTKEAKFYSDLAKETKLAFQKRFYKVETGSYGVAGSDIFALKMGVPEDQYPKVVASLKKTIKSNKGHLDTGIFGTQFFFEVLSENGMHDLAYEAMNKREEPSYGRWLALGATTTWEDWGTSGSHNHPMFGGGLIWYYRQLAGMSADENEPGFRHIIFKPQPAGDLTFAKYYLQTSFGKAGIYWQKGTDDFTMDITVPVGCYATVHIPMSVQQKLEESGTAISASTHVQLVEEKDGYKIVNVQSGDYHFSVK